MFMFFVYIGTWWCMYTMLKQNKIYHYIYTSLKYCTHVHYHICCTHVRHKPLMYTCTLTNVHNFTTCWTSNMYLKHMSTCTRVHNVNVHVYMWKREFYLCKCKDKEVWFTWMERVLIFWVKLSLGLDTIWDIIFPTLSM